MATVHWGDISNGFPWPAGTVFRRKADDSDWETVTIPNVPSFSQSVVTRSLNSSFTPSATNDMYVNYTVSIGTSLSLTGGSQGTVALQISPDGTTWTSISSFTNGQTGTLTIGLSLNQTISGNLSGTVPATYQAKLLTTNNTGTPIFTYIVGQESVTI